MHNHRSKFFLTNIPFVLLVGGVGIVILVLLARNIVLETIHSSERSAFDRSTSILHREIQSYVYGLQGMAGIVITHDFEASLERIREYAIMRDNFKNFAGALGFGFIRYVPREQLPKYLEKIRKQKPNFQIKKISDYVGDHFVIEAIEPFEPNRFAQGLDVATESHRRVAALNAKHTGQSTLTAPIRLVQKQLRGQGFLFFHPIFDRRTSVQKFVGWSYAPILMDDLLASLELRADDRLEFLIRDVTEKKNPLHIFSSPNVGKKKVSLEYTARINVAGRVWEIRGGVPDQRYHLVIDFISAVTILSLLFAFARFVFFMEEQDKKRNDSTKKIGEMESWRQAVLDSAGYSIISTDTEGIIQTFNLGAEEMLGHKKVDVVGKLTPALFHLGSEVVERASELTTELGRTIQPGFDVFVEKTKVLGTSDIREWTYVKKDGSYVPVRLCVTAIRSDKQDIVGFLGIAEDISNLRKLQSLVENQQASLLGSAKMSALGEMASGIAHEINNPLAILDGRLNLLTMRLNSKQPDFDKMIPEVEKMQSTIHRIAKIIQGLRSFSREGKDDPKSPVIINEIIEGTLDLCRERFINHGVKLNLSGDLDFVLSCRAVQISQVLMNLLNNSYDAIQGKAEKWISIQVEKSHNTLSIYVTDCGDGIKPEIVQKMMEPFYTTKDVGKGTGLGLSISNGIMTAHDGKLRYNDGNKNTQFIMEFYNA